MKTLVLAGGNGTRLWPVSRTEFPKQFLKFDEKDSFLQKTIRRCMCAGDVFILTSQDYVHNVRGQVKEIDPSIDILLEPKRRNTAPALALALKYLIDKKGISRDEVVFVAPSDHLISPNEKFFEYLRSAEILAKKGRIVMFGIKPTGPETGYGYIKADSKGNVEQFVEKPNLSTAKEYVASGQYFWNSGMFAFTIETLLNEIKEHAPAIDALLNGTYEEAVDRFSQMPDISIDYAVMEKSKKSILLPLELSWSDVGSWDNVYEMLSKDEHQNAKVGNVIDVDTKNSLILGGKRLIATIGLEDMLVIETPDVILIAKRRESQKVREVVAQLKGKKELDEHVTTERPWGSYTILDQDQRYKIKKILVNPGETLSLQMHYHRSEHWIVVKGTAKVTVEENETYVHENESIYVPKGAKHRVCNPGKVPLEIIEAQVGEYLGEDDIVRFDDVYGRG